MRPTEKPHVPFTPVGRPPVDPRYKHYTQAKRNNVAWVRGHETHEGKIFNIQVFRLSQLVGRLSVDPHYGMWGIVGWLEKIQPQV